MSTTSTMTETPIDVIEDIFKDLRQSFNNEKTKSLSWRKQQLEQICKMCDEQKDAFADAVHKDFHRPNSETIFYLIVDLFVMNVFIRSIISTNGYAMKKFLMHLHMQHWINLFIQNH